MPDDVEEFLRTVERPAPGELFVGEEEEAEDGWLSQPAKPAPAAGKQMVDAEEDSDEDEDFSDVVTIITYGPKPCCKDLP